MSFASVITDSLSHPIDWDGDWGRHRRGQHRDFRGRPYRRGKTRCAYCGAKLPANEVLEEPPYRTVRDGLQANITTRSAFLDWLRAQ